MNDTQKVLIKMLKENTGAHFLDSGGAYGRNWERNQARKFNKEPQAKLDVCANIGKDGTEYMELSPVLSVYHFLSEALEYSPKVDKQFQAFARQAKFNDTGWFEIAEEFAEAHKSEYGHVTTWNSYNGEDYLSQVIQCVIMGEDSGIVLLQIHGGCDVRGGYTKPRAFRWSTEWSPCLFDNARASIFCENRHGWSIEPGYSQGFADESNLNSYSSHVLADGEQPVTGKLCGRDGEAFCPICASKLSAGF